jgi:hypothetical protein
MNIQMATSEIPSVLRGGRVGSSGYSQGRTQSRVGGGRGRGELCLLFFLACNLAQFIVLDVCVFIHSGKIIQGYNSKEEILCVC